MPKEIERKYLISDDSWRKGAEGILYRQGYLSTEPERTVRVRRLGEKGVLTIKGKSHGATRLEYEYEIPASEADELLEELCFKPLIEKTRYRIQYGTHLWEVDEFSGANEGLIVAEVELEDEAAVFTLPVWVGKEVTTDFRYANSRLQEKPYSEWTEEEKAQ